MGLFHKKEKNHTEITLTEVLEIFEKESGTFVPASPYVTVAARCIFSSNREMEGYVYNKQGVPTVMPGSKFKPFFFVSYNFPHLTDDQMQEAVSWINNRFDNRFSEITPVYKEGSTTEIIAYSMKNDDVVWLGVAYNA